MADLVEIDWREDPLQDFINLLTVFRRRSAQPGKDSRVSSCDSIDFMQL